MTVLISNYGKTLRISSVPCNSGTINLSVFTFTLVGMQGDGNVKLIVPECQFRIVRYDAAPRGLPCCSRALSLEFIISS